MASKDPNEPLYRAIGRFVFWFSQLEFTIKAALANHLRIKDKQFDAVVGPYDFAVMCTVAEKVLRDEFEDRDQPKLKAFFNRCKQLNQEVRVIVAHGTWTVGGVRHVSRSTLEAKMHFEKTEKIEGAADDAKKLMNEFFQFGAIVKEFGRRMTILFALCA